MIKKVNIRATFPIRTVTPPIQGSVFGVSMSVGDIFKCICARGIVDEVLSDGTTVRLNLSNYKENNEPVVKAQPVVESIIETAPAVEEIVEEPAEDKQVEAVAEPAREEVDEVAGEEQTAEEGADDATEEVVEEAADEDVIETIADGATENTVEETVGEKTTQHQNNNVQGSKKNKKKTSKK